MRCDLIMCYCAMIWLKYDKTVGCLDRCGASLSLSCLSCPLKHAIDCQLHIPHILLHHTTFVLLLRKTATFKHTHLHYTHNVRYMKFYIWHSLRPSCTELIAQESSSGPSKQPCCKPMFQDCSSSSHILVRPMCNHLLVFYILAPYWTLLTLTNT